MNEEKQLEQTGIGIKIFGARCVVREEKLEEKTAGGIVIPGREKQKTNTGTVILVGDGALLENGTKVPMNVSVGDRVIYTAFSGSPVVVEGSEDVLVILNERDILCVIG